MQPFDKWVKKVDMWDISLIKLSTFFATIWLLLLIPQFMDFIQNTKLWYFFVLMLVCMFRPLFMIFGKK